MSESAAMDAMWNEALWRQFGAAIETLDNALAACPDGLWTEPVWPVPPSSGLPPRYAEFWNVAYHAIVWLDLYLAGAPEDGFVPPAPFKAGPLDSPQALPDRPYTRDDLRAYLEATRERGRAILLGLTEIHARRMLRYSWSDGQPVSFAETQLANLRHVQEHAAHLCLVLSRHGAAGQALGWVGRA